MPLAYFPNTPYLVTNPFIALAAVGAISSTDPRVPSWNPFARNDTGYRNIVLVGQSADSELKFLSNNPHFNPYGFATVTAVLDCQRLYDMLHPGNDPRSIEFLIGYCFPEHNVGSMKLHNAGNDAYCELNVCLMLLKKLADKYCPVSEDNPSFAKTWDAIFIAMDVEALNGEEDKLTELGFACLDTRHINNVHDGSGEQQIRASHIILRDVVPPKNKKGRRWWNGPRYGKGNRETDSFYKDLGTSKEIYLAQVPEHVNYLFFVHGNGKYKWLAPAGLKPQDGGDCIIQRSSTYWTKLVRHP